MKSYGLNHLIYLPKISLVNSPPSQIPLVTKITPWSKFGLSIIKSGVQLSLNHLLLHQIVVLFQAGWTAMTLEVLLPSSYGAMTSNLNLTKFRRQESRTICLTSRFNHKRASQKTQPITARLIQRDAIITLFSSSTRLLELARQETILSTSLYSNSRL